MTQFLLITIYAPIAAHGDTSSGRFRRSWGRPGKSAVLGMVGAALGLDWDATDEHRALADGLGFAVRTDASGESFMDFHTFAAGKGKSASRARTRRDELADEVNTKVTRREYRGDTLYTVALWEREGATVPLDRIAAALRTPHWLLYVGRKSCPLALPLDPQIVETDTLPAALASRPALPEPIAEALQITITDRPEIAADADAPGLNASRIERRQDQYHHRLTYTVRSEHIMEG